ncbi:MAG TPA: SDR family oxidoreductase [Acidimicrobiia bacterium]|nr:SDR family oxidoreductase [Acidimicrobiia bacterium]
MAILITGSSSGIGESLAFQAAQRKHNLVLVARRKEKLDQIAEKLTSEFGIEVEVIAADLTDSKGIKLVEKRILDGGIDILINNAGFGSSGPFVELEVANELNEIDLNVRALVQLSHAAAKTMLEKNLGTIVNISSIASYMPMTGNAVYGATKAFVTSFSHALREELGESGINVMVVCPGMTETEFFERSNWEGANKESPYPHFLWQTSGQVAKLVFSGIDKQRTVVVPGFANKLAAAFGSSLPGSVTRKMTAFVAKGRRLR